MKKTFIFIFVLIIAAGVFVYLQFFRSPAGPLLEQQQAKDLYYCPMHPNFTSDRPGDCPICGMSLVKRLPSDKPIAQSQEQSERKILFYRNPMDPTITSPVPMKDSMGMDYVPVYEQSKTTESAGFFISPQKQQLIGVKKQKVEKRRLTGRVLAAGIVAYDPDLFVAQEEYLQAIKAGKNFQTISVTGSQFASTINAVKRKLLLMGMSDDEIGLLEKSGVAQKDLYLPENGTVWVYISVYEYETGYVKTGLPVEIHSVAFPEQSFSGRIVSIAPVLDRNTRTLKLRTQVQNPGNKLMPEMYVDAEISIDFGEKLAVPEEAVMDTGTKKIVFIAQPDGYFRSADVHLGVKTGGYYEVLDGLSENQMVVTSGNFLIDSESKLNAVFSRMSEPNQ
jgi:Cu(I)/Ag(I) efflux system membrane fusion protein